MIPLLGNPFSFSKDVAADIVVCTGADVESNMVADCRLGRLISPLFGKSPPGDIEVSAEITLTKVDGEDPGLCVGVVEFCTTPADWLPDPLFDAAG